MDINEKLIAAVEKYPLLYKGGVSGEERKRIWSHLAMELQLNEQFIKNRWYMLRQLFERVCQTNGNIKYRKQMQFLLPYIQSAEAARKAQELNAHTPEFVISASDLQSDDESDDGGIIFIDIERCNTQNGSMRLETTCTSAAAAEENGIDGKNEEHLQNIDSTTKPRDVDLLPESQNVVPVRLHGFDELPQPPQPKRVKVQAIQLRKVVPRIIVKNLPRESDRNTRSVAVASPTVTTRATAAATLLTIAAAIPATETQATTVSTPAASPTTSETLQSDDEGTVKIELEEETEMPVEALEESELEEIELPATNAHCAATSSAPPVENEIRAKPQRDEDEIFGELVTAMIKKIPNDKKRQIKKSIMNLLFA